MFGNKGHGLNQLAICIIVSSAPFFSAILFLESDGSCGILSQMERHGRFWVFFFGKRYTSSNPAAKVVVFVEKTTAWCDHQLGNVSKHFEFTFLEPLTTIF